MSIELKVPSVGESITEVMIGEWLKKEGDTVEEDEPVVVIETDKVNVELPAPAAGKITKIVKGDGEDAEVGEVVGYMEAGEFEAESAAEDGSAAKAEAASESKAGSDASADSSATGSSAAVMPAAQRLIAQHGLDASQIEGTGKGGRILKEDVQRHVDGGGGGAKAPQKGAKAATATSSPSPTTASGDLRQEERQKMTPLRRRVAERLVQAQEQAALLTTFNEVDMSEVMALRSRYKADFQDRYGIKLGFMSFFVKATVEALKEIPQVNAEIDGDEIVYKNYQDIGVAIGGGKGLVVPILRNAERMSFADVELQIADYATRAKDGKLKLEELEGGTFTISNGGVYGSLLSTPIVNPPQSGILGLHKIEDRPVAVDGQVVVRPMMYLALTYDHRIIDGREAVTFLIKIKERIEDPSRILLEV